MGLISLTQFCLYPVLYDYLANKKVFFEQYIEHNKCTLSALACGNLQSPDSQVVQGVATNY